MPRVTVDLPEELTNRLRKLSQSAGAIRTADELLAEALRQFLEQEEAIQSAGRRKIQITPAERGSGLHDISIDHDRYLTE